MLVSRKKLRTKVRSISSSNTKSLEIGPGTSPFLDPGVARFLDVASREVLESQYYTQAPEIHYVGEVSSFVGSLCELDLVVSIHSLEHFTDLLGGLYDISTFIKQGGHLYLELPDRRFSFDALSPPLDLCDIFCAAILKSDAVSIRRFRVLQSYIRNVKSGTLGSWGGVLNPLSLPSDFSRYYPPRDLSSFDNIAELIDSISFAPSSHIWSFTSGEFREFLDFVCNNNIIPFRISSFSPTFGGSFGVLLEKRIDDMEPQSLEARILSTLDSADPLSLVLNRKVFLSSRRASFLALCFYMREFFLRMLSSN